MPCPDGDLRIVDSTVVLPDAWSRLESPDAGREVYEAMLYQALPCALEPARAEEAMVTLYRDPEGRSGVDFVVHADSGAFLRVCEDCPAESDCDCQ